jgi:hypothetical protein
VILLLFFFLSVVFYYRPLEHRIYSHKSIVDKASQAPIPDSTIALLWEAEIGEILDRHEYKNQHSLETTIPADRKTRLWISVTASGYETWENAIRSKLNESQPLEITVELEKKVWLEEQG